MNKFTGYILIGFSIGVLLHVFSAIHNNWPMQKILFVSGIEIVIALVTLFFGIKSLKKVQKEKENE
jgi:hypothetical protein